MFCLLKVVEPLRGRPAVGRTKPKSLSASFLPQRLRNRHPGSPSNRILPVQRTVGSDNRRICAETSCRCPRRATSAFDRVERQDPAYNAFPVCFDEQFSSHHCSFLVWDSLGPGHWAGSSILERKGRLRAPRSATATASRIRATETLKNPIRYRRKSFLAATQSIRYAACGYSSFV